MDYTVSHQYASSSHKSQTSPTEVTYHYSPSAQVTLRCWSLDFVKSCSSSAYIALRSSTLNSTVIRRNFYEYYKCRSIKRVLVGAARFSSSALHDRLRESQIWSNLASHCLRSRRCRRHRSVPPYMFVSGSSPCDRACMVELGSESCHVERKGRA